jgi:hypothetical protein
MITQRHLLAGAFFVFAATLTAALGAQTLPPSTQDRQQIAILEYRLSLPGVSPEDRRAIQLQITQLQYQINTRSPVQPLPTLAPTLPQAGLGASSASISASRSTGSNGYGASTSQLSIPLYGSCEVDAGVIQYLQSQLSSPDIGYDERVYISKDELREINYQMSSRRCS